MSQKITLHNPNVIDLPNLESQQRQYTEQTKGNFLPGSVVLKAAADGTYVEIKQTWLLQNGRYNIQGDFKILADIYLFTHFNGA